MNNVIKIIFIVVFTLILIATIFCYVEYTRKDNIYILKKVMNLNVESNATSCIIGNSWHFNSWNYYYELKNRTLYIVAYNLSWINPMAKHEWLEVNIDKGYNDFDEIYLNGNNENKVLIWTKDAHRGRKRCAKTIDK